ncbi:DUF1801 domain-containing protein [Intrasporangium sp.]|uniref:iron chaperone n=1 Tax=Intrasporangium sp. TaxID=1925024 RepID=UPI00293B1AB5|nr:DUF1801 domain-containing protein [Intrasporangium sp.]MDV3221903.1 DUF1801 domain-containing protein [Intrasporangium sp.]
MTDTTTGRAKASRATASKADTAEAFTAEERAAIKERAAEVRASKGRAGKTGKADGTSEVLAKIAEMAEPDRSMAGRIHEVITSTAPELAPRLWYGMPAYAKDGKVVCFFQDAQKFKARYSTLGFNDPATLDDGDMWPTAFAVTKVTTAVEKRIAALVRQAVG